MDDPYTMEYSVEEIEADKVIRVEFRLGFRIQPRINVLFRKVVEDMVRLNEIDILSRYESLRKFNQTADFQFVIIEKFLSNNNEFSIKENFILNSYFAIKSVAQTEAKAFGLDTSETRIEKIPLVIKPAVNVHLKRVQPSDVSRVLPTNDENSHICSTT
jgi:KUP system potassium uptake protein